STCTPSASTCSSTRRSWSAAAPTSSTPSRATPAACSPSTPARSAGRSAARPPAEAPPTARRTPHLDGVCGHGGAYPRGRAGSETPVRPGVDAEQPGGTVPRLVVLRALGLGDLLTAAPALRALAAAFPDHHRVLAAPAALRGLVELIGGVDEI